MPTHKHPTKVQPIVRESQVTQIRGRSRSSHRRDIAAGLYTRGIKIGPQAVGWPEIEVAALNAARIAGQSEEELRELVKALHAMRKRAFAEFIPEVTP